MSDPIAIAGTRRSFKELVDGTLRVQIDIEPASKAQFLRMFGSIDMPVALAPMRIGAPAVTEAGDDDAPAPPAGAEPIDPVRAHAGASWGALGPLCQSAVRLCGEAHFQTFVSATSNAEVSAGAAAEYVKAYCDVASRKDIDGSPGASARFKNLMSSYRAWLEKTGR